MNKDENENKNENENESENENENESNDEEYYQIKELNNWFKTIDKTKYLKSK